MHKPVSRVHLVTYLAALLGMAAAVLWMAGPYLQSLFLGALLATLSAPVRRGLIARGLGPRQSALATTLLTLILIVTPIATVGTMAVRQGISVGRSMMQGGDLAPDRLMRAVPGPARRFVSDPDQLRARLRSGLQLAARGLTGAVLAVTRALPELLAQLALAMLAIYFFLVDGRRFVRWLLSLGAFDERVEDRLIRAFQDAATSSVLAGAAAATCQAALITIAYLSLGIPAAFLAGAGTFLLSWVPIAGSVPVSLAGVLYLWSEGETLKTALMAGFGAFISVADNLVRPWVLKGREEMHPLVGLVAIIGGISLFGLLGILIGPILVAMLTALLDAWPEMRVRLGINGAGSRRAERRARVALLLAAGLAAPAAAQIDPRHRELLQLGFHETLEGRGPLRGYAYLYMNEPDYLGKGRTVRLALAPVYVDAELGLKGALSPDTDLGIGFAGGGYADGYSEIRYGRYLRGESFAGHGVRHSLGVYHNFEPIGPVPVAGVLKVEERHSFFLRDKQTEPSFETPPVQAETRVRTGVRAGGVEPVALPRRAAEASLWYEGRWRVNPGVYGYGGDRRVETSSHLFWSRLLAAWPLKDGSRAQASLSGGTTRRPDRFSAWRLGGVLPMASEFPLTIPGYYYEEVSASDFGLLYASYSRPISEDLKTWLLTLSAATALVEYPPGLYQPQKSHTGVGGGVGYAGLAWQAFLEYGYGVNAVRGHGNGAHSIALRVQYDFLKAGTEILDPANLQRGIDQFLPRR